MPASTGDSSLDRILGGGIPRERTILVTGTPGTGKSTLAMQFLQAGLDAGESGLYISTEQTVDELRESFAPFDFDIDRADLTVTTVHAQKGQTIESTAEELVLTSLEGENVFDASFSPPFETRYVTEFLDRFGPVDRVVLDSVSGLRATTERFHVFRRAVLELVRMFADDFEATAVMTAERGLDSGLMDALQYSTHGVIDLWQEAIRGDHQKFLRVVKLRGVDHDTREFGVELKDGLGVVTRNPPQAVEPGKSTGIEGFDQLTGGGLTEGGTVVFKHDGRAIIDSLIGSVCNHRIDCGECIVLVPSATATPSRVDTLFQKHDRTLADALDNDCLFVLDLFDVWGVDHRNVMRPARKRSVRDLLAEADERSGEDPLFIVKNASTLHHATDEETTRSLRYWIEANVIDDRDVVCDLVNQRSLPDPLVEFYVESAQQVFETWFHENGVQFLTLEKATGGLVGATRLVEFLDEPPFVRVQESPEPCLPDDER